MKSLHFGSSSENDLNLCSDLSYQYLIKGGVLPELKSNFESFVISHQANTLPDLMVNISLLESEIVNIRWNFNEVPSGWRKPYEVPQEIVSPPGLDPYNTLNYYVNVTTNPFQIFYQTANGI